MADIASNIVANIAEKVVTESPKASPSVGSTGASEFEKVLTGRLESQSEMTKQIINAFGGGGQEFKPKSISAEGLEIRTSEVTSQQEIRTHGKTLDLLSDVNRGALQMESMMDMTTSGRKFSPPELLAMQAGMHQIALSIDLTGKIVEQVNTGTKQLLNTSFQ
jgi:hypothetical protein